MLPKHKFIRSASFTAVALLICAGAVGAQTPPKMKMTTDIPAEITTPDSLETPLGTLKLFDGFPDDANTQKVYDNLDFQRGVQVFLNAMPGASLVGMRTGFRKMGTLNSSILLFENLLDSKALFLTGNTDSIYFSTWLDLKDGPLVIETPPKVLAFLDDFWFQYIIDIGNAGPDKGQGGKYLVLPPNYKGEVPEGYFVARSRSYGVWLMGRGFKVDGDPKPAAESIKKSMRIYPLAQAKNPPETKFINATGLEFNTVHANNFHYYEEVNEIVQEEPAEALDPETLGLLASIGIEKGKPFAPDERMKKILTEAAAVGNVTARALSMRPRAKETYYYPGSAWFNTMPGGNHQFLSQPGVRDPDMRVLFHYFYTGITPAMVAKMVGIGSQYVSATTDAQGKGLDGGKTYKVHLPPNVPMKDFWSFTLYDNQTRSMLQTDQQFPSVNSTGKGIVANSDGSLDVWFGPTLPQGANPANWAQTVPGKGWNALFRLYGPLQPWFDKTWRLGEFEEAK